MSTIEVPVIEIEMLVFFSGKLPDSPPAAFETPVVPAFEVAKNRNSRAADVMRIVNLML